MESRAAQGEVSSWGDCGSSDFTPNHSKSPQSPGFGAGMIYGRGQRGGTGLGGEGLASSSPRHPSPKPAQDSSLPQAAQGAVEGLGVRIQWQSCPVGPWAVKPAGFWPSSCLPGPLTGRAGHAGVQPGNQPFPSALHQVGRLAVGKAVAWLGEDAGQPS